MHEVQSGKSRKCDSGGPLKKNREISKFEMQKKNYSKAWCHVTLTWLRVHFYLGLEKKKLRNKDPHLKYLSNPSPTRQEMTQGQFSNEMKLVWIQSFYFTPAVKRNQTF